MRNEPIEDFIRLEEQEGGVLKVNARERYDLEFKQDCSAHCRVKALAAIAAMANRMDGSIIFGVTDTNRQVCGVSPRDIPDEATWTNLLSQHLAPVPEFEMEEHQLGNLVLLEMKVKKALRPPILAIKDAQVPRPGGNNKVVLRVGTIYIRRVGQSAPASGTEFQSLMEERDRFIRDQILSAISSMHQIGYERAAIADASGLSAEGDNVKLFVTPEAARNINIIDRGRLVKSGGKDAYEIIGQIRTAVYDDHDPREPMKPTESCDATREAIENIFWPGFPWAHGHIRKAASHLGFWDDPKDGDGVHTAVEELSRTVKYLSKGRERIVAFAKESPDAFIEVVGSAGTKEQYAEREEQPDE